MIGLRGSGRALAVVGLILVVVLGWLGWQRCTRPAMIGERGKPSAARSTERPRIDGGDNLDARPPVTASDPNLPDPIDFANVDRDRDVHGRVIDRQGDPIPGARIESYRRSTFRVDARGAEEWKGPVACGETISAADGSFALELPWGSYVRLRVVADGFATTPVEGVQAGEWIEIVLGRAAVVTVHAVDDLGDPVEDLRVRLWKHLEGGQGYYRDPASGVTDGEGRVVLEAVPAGDSALICRHDRLANHFGDLRVEPGGDHTVEITIPRGRAITGRVIDGDTREPIAGVHVDMDLPRGETPRAITDPDGRFHLPGFRLGERYLYFLADGYAQDCRWIERDVDDLTVELVRGHDLTGVVTDDDGPVVDADVTLHGSRGFMQDFTSDGFGTRTDSDGRFLFRCVREDLPHILRVEAEGRGLHLRHLSANRASEKVVDLGEIRLTTGYRIDGVVLDEAHEIVEGAIVTWVWRTGGAGIGQERGRATRTDERGRFRFVGVPNGSHRLHVQADKSGDRTSAVYIRDRDATDVRIVLGRPAALSVRFFDTIGDPVADVRCLAGWKTPPDDYVNMRTDRSDENGEAVLTGLPHRRVRLDMRPPTGFVRPRALDVVPSTEPVEVRLARTAVIEGFVVWATGGAASDVRLRAEPRDPAGRRFHATSDRDGAFRLECPMDGVFDLDVVTPSREPSDTHSVAQEFVLLDPPRGVRPPIGGLVLTVERHALDAELEVLVLGPDSQPLADSLVILRSDGRREINTKTEAEGRVLVRGLAPGVTYAVHAYPPASASDEMWFVSKSKKVAPGTGSVTLSVRDAFMIEGYARSVGGAPVSDVWIWARDDEGDVARVPTASDGRFELHVPRGARYELRATRDRAGDTPMSVVEGSEVAEPARGIEVLIED